MIKKSLKKLFRKLGFETKKYNVNTSQIALIERLLAYHHIDLVFDVGANCVRLLQIKFSLSYESLFTK